MSDDARIAELLELLKQRNRPDWSKLMDELLRLFDAKRRESYKEPEKHTS